MSRHVRKKNRATVVATDARAARIRRATAPRSGDVARGALFAAAERLAEDLVSLAIAKADTKAGQAPEESIRAIEARITRGRSALVCHGPEGAELARAVTEALAANGGRALRRGERACTSARPYARRAAGLLAGLVANGMRSATALVRAGAYASSQALADMLEAKLFETDPSLHGVSKSQPLRDGGRITNTLMTFDAALKLWQSLVQTARLELLTALDLEERGRAEDEARAREAHAWRLPPAPAVGTGAVVVEAAALATTSPADAAPANDAPPNGDAAPSDSDATSADGDAAPVTTGPEQGQWCALRRRVVPLSLAATKPPAASDGPSWVARLAEENEAIARWERAVELQRRTLREEW